MHIFSKIIALSIFLCLFLMPQSLPLVSGDAFAATDPTIEGSLPEDPLKENNFELVITVKDVKAVNRIADTSSDYNRIQIYIGSESDPVPQGQSSDSSSEFYFEGTDISETPSQTSSGVDVYEYNFTLKIYGVNSGSLSDAISGGTLSIEAEFLKGDDTKSVVSEATTTLNQESIAANEAPTINRTLAVNSKVIAQWEIPNTIKFHVTNEKCVSDSNCDKSSSKNPRQMNVIAIPQDVGSGYALDALVFTGIGRSDKKTTCTYVPGATDCINCGGDDVYLDVASIQSNAAGDGIVVPSSVSVAGGEASISNLTNNVTYDIVLQYAPRGLHRSTCLTGVPSRDLGITELNGAGEAKTQKVQCYLASEIYKRPDHPAITLFREFRDKTLKNLPLGEQLISGYYKIGPTLAEYTGKSELITKAVRFSLDQFGRGLCYADKYSSCTDWNNHLKNESATYSTIANSKKAESARE